MNALQIEGVVAPKKPIVGILPRCCAQAGYGLTTGASAPPHSNATNARRRKPLIGAVRSIGARLTGFRSKAALIRIQREQAEAAADKIGRFIKEIESQLGWTTQMAQAASTPEQ